MLALLMFLVTAVPTVDSKTIWLNALHTCENPDNIPWIIDSNGLKSFGRFEWQERSWLNYKKQGATRENISDPIMQDEITRYVLENEGESKWYYCSKKLDRTIGKYPIDNNIENMVK